jgi:hypothetical protein
MSPDPNHRTVLIDLAQSWLELAEQEEAQEQSQLAAQQQQQQQQQLQPKADDKKE